MIRLRMGAVDLQRMRFAFSPMTEVAESLYMIHSGRIALEHRQWYAAVRDQLPHDDTALLRAVVPARGMIANFLLSNSTSTRTTIDEQLQAIAQSPVDRLRTDLRLIWNDHLPDEIERLLADPAGPRRLAGALHVHWDVAIKPHWARIRAVLEADVAYRSTRLAQGGIEAMLSDLHPEIGLDAHGITVVGASTQSEHNLAGRGLLLVPCAFAWPEVIIDPGRTGHPTLTYGPRGVGTLWDETPERAARADPLGDLLGRTRAAILIAVAVPRSTTDLARELGQRPPTVSAHLSTLRECGLVTSWRAGRRVLYQRTPLATSVLAASDHQQPDASYSP